MKRLLLLIVLLGFSLTSISQTKSKNYPESGFRANFPKEPTIEKQSIDSEIGKINITAYTCQSDTYMAMISENKFPENLVTKLDKAGVDGLLEGSKNGALKNMSAQMGIEFKSISNEKYLFDNKYQALKSIGKVNEIDVIAIYIMKNNQMFQIIVMGDAASKEINAFFNSFGIID